MLEQNKTLFDVDSSMYDEKDIRLPCFKNRKAYRKDYECTKVDMVAREQRIQYYEMLAAQGKDLFPEIVGLITYEGG